MSAFVNVVSIVLVFLHRLMFLRRVKISAIVFAWVLFLVHSFVPHHHVEELMGLATTNCIAETHGHHHTHAGTNGDGLPYLNHSEEFGSRLLKTDPIVLKLEKHISGLDFLLPVLPEIAFHVKPDYSPLPVFTAATNQAVAKQSYIPRLPGRAPPALS